MHIKRKQKAEGRRRTLRILILSLVVYCVPLFSNAQCAMCRAALEGEGNTAKAEAVNDGIVYLMAIPYILVAGIGYYVYKSQFAKKKQ